MNRKDYTAEEVADWASCGDDTSHWNELFEEQHLSLIHIDVYKRQDTHYAVAHLEHRTDFVKLHIGVDSFELLAQYILSLIHI